MKIEYTEHDLDTIIQYYVDGFKGVNIDHFTAIVDTAKNKVILKLYVNNENIEVTHPSQG